MKKLFDTAVQKLKYKVLREVARLAFEDQLDSGALLDIPAKIMPGPKPTMRCCIYKERAIIGERIKLAMGGNKKNPNVVEVLDIACDECPVEGMRVSEACRGCISHQCVDVCPKGAISIVNHRSVIDQSKCVECGKCLNACPYNAIIQCVRPCESACHINAIHMGEDKKAKIDNEKCISCGACVYKCPFGAIADKSYILEAIKLLKESENNSKYNVYAVVAPSIVSQFVQVRVEQVVSGLKHLGFFSVVEAAMGADMVAWHEAQELAEKGFLTSSCCPAFVHYVQTEFPKLKDHISSNLSPMAMIAKYIKETTPGAKVVFIGPCTAKKMEFQQEHITGIDCVITFEELQALFDAREVNVENLEESLLDNASYYGRIFARSGGLSDAVAEALKEHGIPEDQFKANPIACDGIEECRIALLKANKNLLPNNFIEGMACVGGCIGGAACVTHGPKDKTEVNKYGQLAKEKTILDAIAVTQIAK